MKGANMTTARLEILDGYSTDISDFIDFRDALGRWACKFVPEIATPIACAAKELFENRAVYALVMHWDKLNTTGREMRLRDFAQIADSDHNFGDCDVLSRNTWEREAGEISQALYYLIIQKWD